MEKFALYSSRPSTHSKVTVTISHEGITLDLEDKAEHFSLKSIQRVEIWNELNRRFCVSRNCKFTISGGGSVHTSDWATHPERHSIFSSFLNKFIEVTADKDFDFIEGMHSVRWIIWLFIHILAALVFVDFIVCAPRSIIAIISILFPLSILWIVSICNTILCRPRHFKSGADSFFQGTVSQFTFEHIRDLRRKWLAPIIRVIHSVKSPRSFGQTLNIGDKRALKMTSTSLSISLTILLFGTQCVLWFLSVKFDFDTLGTIKWYIEMLKDPIIGSIIVF